MTTPTSHSDPNGAHAERGSPDTGDPVAAWQAAAKDPHALELYRDTRGRVDLAMAKSRATCLASGRCCQFAAFGHRLYVTGLEAAIVLDAAREAGCEPTLDAVEAARARGSCPFLQGRACGIHAIRPIPCRAFFCDRHAGPEVAHAHETAHGELRGLHDALRVPYAYSEWTDHLSRLVGSTHGDIMES